MKELVSVKVKHRCRGFILLPAMLIMSLTMLLFTLIEKDLHASLALAQQWIKNTKTRIERENNELQNYSLSGKPSSFCTSPTAHYLLRICSVSDIVTKLKLPPLVFDSTQVFYQCNGASDASTLTSLSPGSARSVHTCTQTPLPTHIVGNAVLSTLTDQNLYATGFVRIGTVNATTRDVEIVAVGDVVIDKIVSIFPNVVKASSISNNLACSQCSQPTTPDMLKIPISSARTD